ncbi:YfiR/HmsC family protein [uncultured Dokdonia sp.]|uniref:YfiR/HmsC family protein n=1 Tax=uncultured Dokdonia sp. TaxID=575653 RepID=UPI0026260FD7|nr:YfiR/HmsC family protein [uncultured Dokdonia sp.]
MMRGGSFLKSVIIIFFLGALASMSAQQNTSQVSRVQRAIYIFNIAQQVSWPEQLDERFKIGVLGPDRTLIDLRAMAQKRKIQERQVSVSNFLSIKDIQDVDVLYVNRKYNYQMPYILQSLENKGILVIAEDYLFNSSMINIVSVGDTFRHQLNEGLLSQNDFIIAPSLQSYAIASSEKWQALFQEAQDSLQAVLENAKQKDELINRQEQELVSQNEIIDTIQEIVKYKDSSIQELQETDKQQKKTIEKTQEITEELEDKVKNQLIELDEQQVTLRNSAKEIETRQDSIEVQKVNISDQKKVLLEQSSELNLRTTINWLLTGIALLFLIAGFVLYKNYRTKKKLIEQLTLQNTTILEQKEELSQKNEDLEQFAYIASHDLQEPLNTISSFIGLIRGDYGEQFDEVGLQSLEFIEEASDRMAKLINMLLEYSRIGKTRVFTQVDTHKVLQDLEKDITSLVTRTGGTINYTQLPVVSGSEVELRLLFQNLITNALKFCPEDRRPILNISTTKVSNVDNPSQGMWQFSFSDNGIGIHQAHQDRIFSIFQRLHTNDEYEGTGIGLAHCKKIVSIHKGSIWLDSELGKGTTFYFTIPYGI